MATDNKDEDLIHLTDRELREELRSIVLNLEVGLGEIANTYQACFRAELREQSHSEALASFSYWDDRIQTMTKVVKQFQGLALLYFKLGESTEDEEDQLPARKSGSLRKQRKKRQGKAKQQGKTKER